MRRFQTGIEDHVCKAFPRVKFVISKAVNHRLTWPQAETTDMLAPTRLTGNAGKREPSRSV